MEDLCIVPLFPFVSYDIHPQSFGWNPLAHVPCVLKKESRFRAQGAAPEARKGRAWTRGDGGTARLGETGVDTRREGEADAHCNSKRVGPSEGSTPFFPKEFPLKGVSPTQLKCAGDLDPQLRPIPGGSKNRVPMWRLYKDEALQRGLGAESISQGAARDGLFSTQKGCSVWGPLGTL